MDRYEISIFQNFANARFEFNGTAGKFFFKVFVSFYIIINNLGAETLRGDMRCLRAYSAQADYTNSFSEKPSLESPAF